MSVKISKEVKAGVIILIAIVLFIWGFHFLKGKDLFEKTNTYYAVYERVDGLQASAPIFVNGLKIGSVSNIRFLSDTNSNVLVEFKISTSFIIQDSSVAEIFSSDLMGTRALRIVLSKSQKYYRPGDTLISSIEADLKQQVSAQVLPLKKKAEDLIKSIDSVMTVVRNIFDKQTRYNISRSFESIKNTIESLEHSSITLDTLVQSEKYALTRIISNVESITENFRNNNELITNVLKNLSSFSDSLQQANIKQTVINANRALVQTTDILEKINRGEGTIGMLIHNEKLYNNLENSSRNLDLLLKDLRENPKRYLHFSLIDFGRTVVLNDNEKNRNKYQPNNGADTVLTYQIQIRSSKNPIPPKSREFKGLKDVNEHFVDGWYKYTVGKYASKVEAVKAKNDLTDKFPDAYIISFRGEDFVSNADKSVPLRNDSIH